MEEEHGQETEVQVHPEPEPEVKKAPEVPAPPKEAERQLSKKERKKKELAELEALLADFGVAPKESNGQEDSQGNFYPPIVTSLIVLISCIGIGNATDCSRKLCSTVLPYYHLYMFCVTILLLFSILLIPIPCMFFHRG